MDFSEVRQKCLVDDLIKMSCSHAWPFLFKFSSHVCWTLLGWSIKEKGTRVIFLPSLKMKFIYLTADGTKPPQVLVSSRSTGPGFFLWAGGRWLQRHLSCFMAFPQKLFYCQVQICGTRSTTFKQNSHLPLQYTSTSLIWIF